MLELRRIFGIDITELAKDTDPEEGDNAGSGWGPWVRGRGLVRCETDCWRHRGYDADTIGARVRKPDRWYSGIGFSGLGIYGDDVVGAKERNVMCALSAACGIKL